MSKKKNPLFVWGYDRKSVPRDHRLSSFGKPRDAERWSPGRIFLSYPHTRDGFLNFPVGYREDSERFDSLVFISYNIYAALAIYLGSLLKGI